MEMKVFKMNDCDWVVATSKEEAKSWYMNEVGFTAEEVDTDFEREVSLENTMGYELADIPEEERGKFPTKTYYGIEFASVPFWWVIKQDNITKPCVIASTEY